MRTAWLLSAGLAALSATLYWPIFSPLDRPYRESIAPGYAGITRFIAAHPDPWGWNPQPYGGLPTQFVYLPGLPYLGAALSWLTGLDPAWTYRLVSATMAMLGPVTLFWLLRRMTGSNAWAAVVAGAYVVWSPLYGLVEAIDKDRGLVYLPWRLMVLMKYGEGPHNAALTLLPLAWLGLWRAATRPGFAALFTGALALAAVPLMNWIGALALGISCGLLLLSVWGKAREHQFSFRRAFRTAGLAYTLVCFWLTPCFIRTTALNWPKDAFGYRVDNHTVPLVLGWLAGLLVIRLLILGRREVWLCFGTLLVWAFGYVVVIYYARKEDVLPESRRYAVEFELAIFIALALWLYTGLKSRNGVHRFCAIAPMMLFLLYGGTQLSQTLKRRTADWQLLDPANTPEAKISNWLAAQRPRGRVFVTGGLRFRLNRYTDLAQLGGTFESGLHNRVPLGFIYQIRTGIGSAPGQEGHDAVRQLVASGVEYVVVHGFDSDEFYRDYRNPAKFDGILERVASFGADHVFRVPFRSLAAVVRREELPVWADWRAIQGYAGAFGDPGRPLIQVREAAPGDLQLTGVPPGALVALNVNHHEGWRASGATVAANPLGGMLLQSGAGGDVRLRYEGTREQKLFGALSGIAWLGCGAGLLSQRWRRRLPAPRA